MKFTHILDNGHGGIIDGVYQTAGKRSPKWKKTQLFEGDYNRKIVSKIAEYCDLFGYKYHILVPELEDISLRQRVVRANALHQQLKKKTVLWSIHGNGFTNQDVHGFEVFTSPGQTKSDAYASLLLQELEKRFPNELFRKDFTDKDADKEARFTMLTRTAMPAILSENGFMTNFRQCQLMLQELWQTQVALAHFAAIKQIEAG